MAIGMVGCKRGMTRIFTEEGASVPVTVVELSPNRVTQIKDMDNDGYTALQITWGERKANRLSKPAAGHFAKAGVEAGKGLMEFRALPEEMANYSVGGELDIGMFEAGQRVDVSGVTRGKGFAGVVKRHHFRTQDATHGNSLAHRAPGSIGQRQTPGRVFKGKRMAGHMGNVQRTIQNLEIVRVDGERNLLLIKGAVPGAPGGDVVVRLTTKTRRGKNQA